MGTFRALCLTENAQSGKVNSVLQKRGCGWESPGRFSALQMDGGIFSGHFLYARQKSQILVGNHVLVLICSPCTLFSHGAGYKQYSLVIHGPHLGCALLHARAKLPFAKGKFPSLRRHQLLEKESRQLSQQRH